MKNLALLLGAILVPAAAHADIICKGQTNYGPATVQISQDESKVTVSGAGLSAPRVFTNLSVVNGMITAPDLAVTWQNWFGCIHNAVVITDFNEPIGAGYTAVLDVAQCSGGSTPDDTCGIR